jgi:uncharacterized protein (TIGR03437 family)
MCTLNSNARKWTKAVVLAGLALSSLENATGQTVPPIMLEIDIENVSFYNRDVADYARLATGAGAVPATVARNFAHALGVGDIVAVNGRPAKGIWTTRIDIIAMSENPQPGQMIADVTRAGLLDWIYDILTPEGQPIGTIMATGLNGGPPPPGQPVVSFGTSMTVVGGTGAFLGARGQTGIISAVPNRLPNPSMVEDPGNRRVNSRSSRKVFVHLIPMTQARIVTVYHQDFSPVTAARPLRRGMTAILRVTGLGPTRSTRLGQPYPSDPLDEVDSPVEVFVNGQAGMVLNKVGWPGTTDEYRVDVVIPDGAAATSATVQLVAAWIPSLAITLPLSQ